MRNLVLASIIIVVLGVGCPIIEPPPAGTFKFTSAAIGDNLQDRNELGPPAYDGLEGEAEGEGDGGEPREVVEPDVIRRDGNILYVLNQYRGLTLIDLDGEQILSQVPTYGYPRDLYFGEGRAYVLVGYAYDYVEDGDTLRFSVASRLIVVDTSDPASASIIAQFDLEGDLIDSRLVGDVLYAVCAEYQWYWAEAEGGTADVAKEMTSSSWVTSLCILESGDVEEADQLTFPGAGNLIQATPEAIFVATPHWRWEDWEFPDWVWDEDEDGDDDDPDGTDPDAGEPPPGEDPPWQGDYTTITYVDISDPLGAMTVRGSIDVPGHLADRFKMDAYEGVLRVVSGGWFYSSGWQSALLNFVTTIDLANPDELAEMDSLLLMDAIGEGLHATRFDGDRAYVVTFRWVDPLFVVDLADPSNIQVSGALGELPGWSTHIVPQGNRLLALGVDNSEGEWLVCVSLFDVADPTAPQMLDRETFGEGWTWSVAHYDDKALTVLDDLLIVPVSGWQDGVGGYERLQFVSYTADDLDARGYAEIEGSILRSFQYGDLFYGVTTEQLAIIDASDLEAPIVTGQLTLAEYVADFFEITAEVGIEIVSQYDTGMTTMRTVDLGSWDVLGEVEVGVGWLNDVHLYGASVLLVGTVWNEDTWDSDYVVAIVDCSDPADPGVGDTIRLEVEPCWGWYWWGPYPYDVLLERNEFVDKQFTDMASWWFPTTVVERSFLVGDILALRCSADEYDVVFGENPWQGLVLVDLADGATTSTVGLGYDSIVSLNVVDDKLYVGTSQYAGTAGIRRSLCAYFLRELDLRTMTAGPAANVPGVFVQYDRDADILTLRDDQWDASDYCSNLNTAAWTGSGAVTELDSIRLPDGAGLVIGRGEKVFIDAYTEVGYHLYAASVSPAGDLALSAGLLVTDQWGWLTGAHDDSAYVTVGGGAVAHYDFSEGGELSAWLQVMGAPQKLRFGSSAAYAALGYFGLALLPL